MQIYVHCILGISQQHCEIGQTLVFHFSDEEAEIPKMKRVGLNDGTELGLDPMSPHSQPLRTKVFKCLSLLPYLGDSVMNSFLRKTYCGLERTYGSRVRTLQSCCGSSRSSIASNNYFKTKKDEEDL